MVSKKQMIFYFYDPNTNEFFFYDSYDQAKIKRDESNLIMQFKTLKKYYGTIYLCRKGIVYSLHDHYGSAKNQKQYGYKIEKIVLTDYKEFKKQLDYDEKIEIKEV